MKDDINVRELIDDGYDVDEINELLEDEGYDAEDKAEAWIDAGYGWEDALQDAIREQQIDLDDAGEYADLLGMNIHEIYDMYFGYEET